MSENIGSKQLTVNFPEKDRWIIFAIEHIVETAIATGHPTGINETVRRILRSSLYEYRDVALEMMKRDTE